MYKITRIDLYNMVWKKSMLKVSKELGISDRGLAKICNKHNIPTPYVGYWAKKENGYKVKQPSLTGNHEEVISFATQSKNIVKDSIKQQKKDLLIYDQINALPFIANTNERSINVSKYINGFKKSAEYEGKFLINKFGEKISICNLDGVVNILTNIEHMVKILGGTFCFKNGHISIKIWDGEFCLSVFEICNRFTLRKEKICSWSDYERLVYSYNATNEFTINITNGFALKKYNFSTTKKHNAEYIIKNMLKSISTHKIYRRREEIKQLRDAAERRKREKEWKLSYEQNEKKKVKIEKLQEQIVRWQKVEIVRKYIKYFIHSAVQNKHKIKSISNTRKYIEFMKEYADKIDPISDFLEN